MLDPHLRHAARVILAACFTLVWLAGYDCFFEYLPGPSGQPSEAGAGGVVERCWAALYTPAVWFDQVLQAWLDEPEAAGSRLRLLVLCFAQVVPFLMLAVGGWPRAALWREAIVAYAMIWVCLAVAGFIQLRGGITVFDS